MNEENPRSITTHRVNGLNEAITIKVLDGPGPGGASHLYSLEVDEATLATVIKFQKGPIQEAGINGISNEALLAVVIDRLRSFQAGPFACRDNAVALTHLETGLMWLQQRTRDRISRGVEGTYQK